MALNVMQAGGTNIIMSKFDPELALNHIQDYRVTFFGEFKPMLESLLEKAEKVDYDLSSLKAYILKT